MPVEPTASGGGDPGHVTRIAEEFIRLHEVGQVTDLDEFCARYPEDQRAGVRNECEQLLRIHGVIKQPDRLSPGQTLGSYKIIESIGKGGMGEVYRARDSELDRDIAIKVLPPELACQPERVKRFKREAKAIAALDHPNIVTVHSVEESDGLHFITMQLVQGKTLSALIPKKGMALGDYFDLAIPLTDAISTAHESGITHRDLKPANIMVTSEGRVEILDFGLAKLTEQTSPEQTTKLRLSSLTDEGQIVGTVAYMSPEQAEGREVDHRTDIFSLGIILYEMITGERPFKGESRVALMSSIMKDTPSPVTELKATLPRHLARIVKRCLAKDFKQRYQTATDVCNELEELKKEIDSGVSVAPLQQAGGRKWLWPAASAVLVVALALALVLPRSAADVPDPVPDTRGPDRGPLVVAEKQLTDLDDHQNWPSISHDGEIFVYTDYVNEVGEIFWRPVDGGTPRNLTQGNPEDDYAAAFHPKEQKIAFRWGGSGIWEVGITEQARRILDHGFRPAWSPEGDELVYQTARSSDPYYPESTDLRIVDVATGDDRSLIQSGSPFDPSWSPKDKWIAFANRRDIWVIPPSGGDPIPVTDDGYNDWNPIWSPNGRYLYFISDREAEVPGLWRVMIHDESGRPQGSVERVWAPTSGFVMRAAISGDGSRIVCRVVFPQWRIQSYDFNPESGQLADGEMEGTLLYSTNKRVLMYFSVSPDDNWLAYCTRTGREDVWVIRTDGSDNRVPRPVTEDAFSEDMPDWYPDPEDIWLTFGSDRNGSETQIYAVQPESVAVRALNIPGGAPRWWPDLPDARLRAGGNTYMFLDGIRGERSAPLSGGLNITANGSFSRDGELWAKTAEPTGPPLTIHRGREQLHVVANPVGDPYDIYHQHGNRWLDNTRLIFWDYDSDGAYLWNTDTREATLITGLEHRGEYAFSREGRKLFAMERTSDESEIFLLELDPEAHEITWDPVDPVIALPRVFLGATVKVNRRQRLEELSATDPQRGVLVVEVPEGSIAEVAGLQPDDVILRVGGIETNNPSDLQPAYLQTPRSEQCEFIIFRDKEERRIQVEGVLAVRLTGEDVKQIGNGPRNSYDPYADSLGWDNELVSLAWDVAWRGSATFDVWIELGGENETPGEAEWALTIAGERLEGYTQTTTEFQRRTLGEVKIEANGDIHAQLDSVWKRDDWVMHLRAIELIAK